jgi:hypothetical protein
MHLDALSALITVDYSDSVIYYKLGSKCAENVKQFVVTQTLQCFGGPKFKIF